MAAGGSFDTRRHQVVDTVERLHTELDRLTGAHLWSVSPAQAGDLLVATTRLVARCHELQLRVAAHADRVQVGDSVGATSTASWWATETKQTRAGAHREMRLAKALDGDHERVGDALAAGRLMPDQAQVIVDAVDALPTDLVDRETRHEVEHYLIRCAEDHDAKELRILGRRALEVIAPEIAEAHEKRILEKEEADANAAAKFTMVDDGHGKAHGKFTIPSGVAEMLRKHLTALANPARHPGDQGTGEGEAERKPLPHRMGQAFIEYIERYPVDHTPNAGGTAATVVVTMTLEALLGADKAATLDTGGVISAAQARHWACEAGIIPVVLDGTSQPLDVGRERRFHTKAQRIAIALRDGGCTAQGCDWPPGMCHTHHDTWWSKGGTTNITDGRLLCPHHHTRAHDPTYTMTKLPGGKVAFTRRP